MCGYGVECVGMEWNVWVWSGMCGYGVECVGMEWNDLHLQRVKWESVVKDSEHLGSIKFR